jgi:hypothetical protein
MRASEPNLVAPDTGIFRESHMTRIAMTLWAVAITGALIPGAHSAGPSDGMNVNVLNTPLPVAGTVKALAPDGSVTLYRHYCLALLYSESRGACDFPTVPAGYRLVVETIAGRLGVATVSDPTIVPGIVELGKAYAGDPSNVDNDVHVNLPWTLTGVASAQRSFQFLHGARVYFEAGETPRLAASFSAVGAPGFSHVISGNIVGRLVPVTQ